jgi:hypothetical protein
MSTDHPRPSDPAYLTSVYRIHAAVFVDSAQALAERLEVSSAGAPTTLKAIPFYLLASHATELFLKSALLKRGFSDKELRQIKYRHNLSELLSALQRKGVAVAPQTEEMVRHFSTQHEHHSLRYTALVDDGRPTYMPPSSLVFSMLDELLLLTRISTQGR